MLEWLIVGGGIHGTHLSLVLTEKLGFSRDGVRVLDPHHDPLAHWRQYVDNTGMRHMRSSSVHHLDLDPYSLREFARRHENRWMRSFKYPYQRPGSELFWRHCLEVIDRHCLLELRIKGSAEGMHSCGSALCVRTGDADIRTRRVLLAIGMGDQPCWPDWAAGLKDAGVPVDHLYENGFLLDGLPEWNELLVVGGGIGAAQAAVKLADRLPGRVTMLRRHGTKIQQFDSDPGWNGPRRLKPFLAERDFDSRRGIIDRARYRGSMPADVAAELDWYVRSGKVKLIEGDVDKAQCINDKLARLALDGADYEFDRVVLACGFEKKRPGGDWLDTLVRDFRLPVSSCGFPVVDSALRWSENIFVCGPLAELELGPVARNISGARHAGHRLFRHFSNQPHFAAN